MNGSFLTSSVERLAEANEGQKVHLHTYSRGLFVAAAIAIAIGGAAAGVLAEIGSDWLESRCLFPSQIECERGRPIFQQSDMPDPNWLQVPPHGGA